MQNPYPSRDLSSRWTLRRFLLLPTGQCLNPRNSYNVFWDLQKFLRRFIQGYSRGASPLPALTSNLVPFRWSSAADKGFQTLKARLTSAPILPILDPARQFVVEVDASDAGVKAMLSQQAARRLSSAERNYNIRNCELLAVKMALEEWCHWLEEASIPFFIWTDHRNLEYICTAKRLNSRQARWSLFFKWFNFTLSYPPESLNVKPDVLSWQFRREDGQGDASSSILSPSCMVASLSWETEEKVRSATQG